MGIEAALITPIVGVFVWFVRRAIRSMDAQLEQHAAERAEWTSRADTIQREFTDYLKTTATQQTEVLAAVANTLERSSRDGEERHAQVMKRLDQLAAEVAR